MLYLHRHLVTTRVLPRWRAALSSAGGGELRGRERKKFGGKAGEEVLEGRYRVVEEAEVEERHLRMVRLEHVRTGAQHVHLEADDCNNAFSVLFRTPPTDDSGKAHVLEHLALCGSRRYPVRDPFFHMLSRSLNTYMNAWTGGDYTQYPFTTQNAQDYRNLLGIYLDAAFFPLLDRLDFLQEGHRLEQTEGGLCFKGVVLNEMKGAMADPGRRFVQALESALLPDTPYALNSGGDPLAIPGLRHEELVRFHERLYHPSNATFLTYGDLPLEGHLEAIDACIAPFSRRQPSPDPARQQPFQGPREASVPLPVIPGGNEGAQAKVAQAWMLNDTSDVFESFSLGVLASLLVNGPNSPLYRALIDAGLGADLSPGTGYHTDTPQAMFSVGLTGVSEPNVPLVLAAIRTALEEAATAGFPEERVRSLLHQMEIGIKYVRGNFGIELIGHLTPAIMTRAPIAQALRSVSLIDRLKASLGLDQDDPNNISNKNNPPNTFFQDLIRRYLLDNPHRVTLVGRPDPELSSREAAREAELLARAIFTPEDAAAVAELNARQSMKPNVDCLPTLRVPEDLSPLTPKYSHARGPVSPGVDVLVVDQPTNSLSSFRMISPFPSVERLPVEAYPYVPFFCFAFNQLGTRRRGYAELSQQIESHTADVSAAPHFTHLPSSLGQYEVGVEFSGMCLGRNHGRMFDILSELFTEGTSFEDLGRLEILWSQYASSLEDSLLSSAHQFAVARSKAALSPQHALSDIWSGLTAFRLAQRVQAACQTDDRLATLSQLAAHLRAIAAAVLVASPAHTRCLLVSEPEFCRDGSTLQQGLRGFLSSIPLSPYPTLASSLPASLSPPSPLQELVEMPLQLCFAGQSLPGLPLLDGRSVGMLLACRLLSKKYLHNEIREKGGAYGAGVLSSDGAVSFYTYRDPNPARSFQTMQRSLEWVSDSSLISDEDIDEAKLGIFADLDAPTPPTQKGLKLFRSHITHDIAQSRRDQILACTRAQIVASAQHCLAPSVVRNSVVVGENLQAQLPHFQSFPLDS